MQADRRVRLPRLDKRSVGVLIDMEGHHAK